MSKMKMNYSNLKGQGKVEFHLVNGDEVVGSVEEADADTVALKDVRGSEQAMQVWIVVDKIVSFTQWNND